MSQRRSTFWMPFSEGNTQTIVGAGVVSRISIPSIRETEVGREYERYTVTRTLVSLSLRAMASTVVVAVGIISLQEGVQVLTVTPAGDPSADWLWLEEFQVTTDSAGPSAQILRDLRGQRKARGGDSDLFFYVENRSGVNSLEVHRFGRCLVKRA